MRKAGAKLDQRDGLLGKHKTWKAFSDIEVKWIDDRNLEVSCKENNSTSYLENNFYNQDGTVASSNAERVAEVSKLINA